MNVMYKSMTKSNKMLLTVCVYKHTEHHACRLRKLKEENQR